MYAKDPAMNIEDSAIYAECLAMCAEGSTICAKDPAMNIEGSAKCVNAWLCRRSEKKVALNNSRRPHYLINSNSIIWRN